MNNIYFFLEQQARRAESTLNGAEIRIATARTMRDVTRLASEHVDVLVRHHTWVVQAKNDLRAAAEKRLRELMAEHIQRLDQCLSLDAFTAERGRLMHTAWSHLRGDFGHLYGEVERASARIRARLAGKEAEE